MNKSMTFRTFFKKRFATNLFGIHYLQALRKCSLPLNGTDSSAGRYASYLKKTVSD